MKLHCVVCGKEGEAEEDSIYTNPIAVCSEKCKQIVKNSTGYGIFKVEIMKQTEL